MIPNDICCDIMKDQLTMNCEVHGLECPDKVVIRGSQGPLLQSPNATYVLHFCPWCGTQVNQAKMKGLS